MHIISRKKLNEFADRYPEVKTALRKWYKLVKQASFNSFAEVKDIFSTADQVGMLTVFNIGGNKVRLITAIHYNRKKSLYSCCLDSL